MNTNLITAILSTVLVTNSFIQWPKRVKGFQPLLNPLAGVQAVGVQAFAPAVEYEDDTSSHTRLQVTEVRRVTTLIIPSGPSFEISNVVVFSTNYAEELVWTRSPTVNLGLGITNVGPMIILGEGIIAITNKNSIVLRYTGTNYPN